VAKGSNGMTRCKKKNSSKGAEEVDLGKKSFAFREKE